jgi:hypothetical protein
MRDRPSPFHLALLTRHVPVTALGELHRKLPLPALGFVVIVPVHTEPGSGMFWTGQLALNCALPALSTVPVTELSPPLLIRPPRTTKKPLNVLVLVWPPPTGYVNVKS